MGAGNLKQVSPTECRCPFDKTSFDLQRKTRGAKCNGRGSPGNGHTSSTNQTGVAMHRNLFQVFKLFHHLAALLIAGSTTKGIFISVKSQSTKGSTQKTHSLKNP